MDVTSMVTIASHRVAHESTPLTIEFFKFFGTPNTAENTFLIFCPAEFAPRHTPEVRVLTVRILFPNPGGFSLLPAQRLASNAGEPPSRYCVFSSSNLLVFLSITRRTIALASPLYYSQANYYNG